MSGSWIDPGAEPVGELAVSLAVSIATALLPEAGWEAKPLELGALELGLLELGAVAAAAGVASACSAEPPPQPADSVNPAAAAKA